MAHPRRTVALDRKALTVGLTAALLTLPLAGMASAATTLEAELTGATEGELLDAEALETPIADTPEDDLVGDVVAEVSEPLAEAPAPVAEVLPPAPAPDSDADGGTDGGANAAGDGDYQPVTSPPAQSSAPAGTSRSADATATSPASEAPANRAAAPALRNDLRTTSGFRSGSERPNLQPAQAPLVSSPFAVQAPTVAGDGVQTPLSALSAAPAVVADVYDAVTATPLPSHPTAVPGALTATAAALVLMLGAGHVLHRNGTLQRSFAR